MLDIEQIQALNAAKAGHNLLICGQAGTGKTFVLKSIVNDLKRRRNVALLCTTGIGCMQYADIGARTVHSFAGLQDGRYDMLTLENLVRYDDKYHKVRENVASCETMIVDETSMLSMKYLEQLELVCRICRNSNTLFGGIQVIFCGDFYQLPPVPSPLHNDNGQFCFESDVFQNSITHKIVLKKVIRQDEEIFIKAVRETAVGGVSDEVDAFLNSLQRPLEDGAQNIKHLFPRNYDAAVFNNNCLDKIASEGKIYKALKNSGSQKYLRRILAPQYLHLKISCPVVLLSNLGGKLMNGLSGKVEKLEDDYVTVYFGEINETHRLGRQKFTQFSTHKKCVVAEREQFPLYLGYGLTIHKSQGMTLENVVVHCNGIFEAGQLSVAIGRAVSSNGLCLIGYRRGLCRQPKPIITAFYGECSHPFSDDLTCCRSNTISNTNIQTPNLDCDGDDTSDFNDDDLAVIDDVIQDYYANMPSVEQLQSEEELPDYIKVKLQDLKMHCFMTVPATQTHVKYNEICNAIDINTLKYFCQIQLKRIKVLTSDLVLESKCTPKQWTSVLGTNHMYFESLQYTSSVKALFPGCDISVEHKFVASSIIMELLKAEIHNRCSDESQVSGAEGVGSKAPAGLNTEMSGAGKAKVRYVAGMCVAKLRNHYMNMVITNLNNPNISVKKNVKNASEKVTILKQMVGDETLDFINDETLQEIERRQNVRRGLTYVNDLSYQFFLNLLNKINSTLNTENFRKQEGDIFEWTYSYLVKDEDLQMLFAEISTCENYEIKSSVFNEIVHKFLMVCHKQFLKDTKDRLNIIKKKAHREEINKRVAKRKSEVEISMKDIVIDKSEDRETSHLKLKLNCKENESYLCGRNFTKAKLMELCRAYGVHCTSNMTKQQIAKDLHKNIIKSDKMSSPESLSSDVLPSTSSHSQSAAAPKRQKVPGKGKGKGKGKKKSKSKYVCRVCSEIYIDGEEWIQCDDCNTWLHRTCEDVSDEQWEVLQGEDVPWSCSQCC